MKPFTLEWRIPEKASLPTPTEAPCQKIFFFFKILKSQNFENSKKFWGPFLGSF
jgi:hypothetical protein